MQPFHPTDTRSLWSELHAIPRRGTSIADSDRKSFDAVVIGAGVTGLTAALRLQRAGRDVAVLDFDRVGSGETRRTTAHLTERLDAPYADLIAAFGEGGARLAAEGTRFAIDWIESTSRGAGIDCEFRRVPGYSFATDDNSARALEKERDAALRAGVRCEAVERAPLPFAHKGALKFPRQARIHPTKYLDALSGEFLAAGGRIFEGERMGEVEETRAICVRATTGSLRAERVIVAANAPNVDKFHLQTKIAAYRTYAMSFPLRGHWAEDALFWDDEDPYHYVRLSGGAGGEAMRLIVGGEDRKTGQDQRAPERFDRLEEWTRARFDVGPCDAKWSGQIVEPVDGLPYVGRLGPSDRVLISVGYSGNGMTWGTLGGLVCADLALGIGGAFADLLDSRRFKPVASAKRFIAENVDFPSIWIGDWLRSTGESADAVRENEGAIVRIEGRKAAVYRDPEGELHWLSPTCPHLGCDVAWNDAEKSWDCPCHGSRFDPLGRMINGPSVTDLAPLDDEFDLPAPAPVGPERGIGIGSRFDQAFRGPDPDMAR